MPPDCVRKLMTAEELTALGSEMLALFQKLLENKPRMDVRRQTRKPASI